jgi:hypothetical protein
MRKFISILNLILAAAATCLTMLVLVASHTIQAVLPAVVCVVWTLCAVMLLRSRRLWPWVGCLVAVSAATLQMGAETLRFLALTWRAEYGDRSIELDPSTIGIPLFFSGLFTIGALFILIALLSLPVWPVTKKQMPNKSLQATAAAPASCD